METRQHESRILFALSFVFLLLAAIGATAANFTATLERDTTSVSEAVTLTLAFEGGSPKVAPTFPAIQNLSITHVGQSRELKFSTVNGQSSAVLNLSYQVVASQPGDYVIPALRVAVDGSFITSQQLKLKVLKSGEQAGDVGKIAFLQMTLPKKEVYVGEAFPVRIDLFAQAQGQIMQAPQLKTEGMTVGKLVEAGKTQIQTNNVAYGGMSYLLPVTVIKTGDLKLQAADCIVDLQFRRRTQRNRDPFFDLGDLFSDGRETRRFTLSSDPQTLHVLPLPTENRPANFSGAVGSFTMTTQVSPTNIAVGDPITVKIQIAGRGALDPVSLPAQENWREFKTYPPTARVETTDNLGLQGVKTFEQVVVPQNAEIKTLPEFYFTFFDPEQKNYRLLKQPATALIVRPSGSAQLPPASAENPGPPSEAPATQDIVHIKPNIGAVASFNPLLVEKPWFLALQGAPFVAWLAAFVSRKRRENLANNPRLRRKRQVARTIQTGLVELRGLALNNQAEEFFATAFRLLQEQLGERLDLPATAITEAIIEERLRPRGVNEETLTALHELFQICNQARYAPNHSAQELTALVPKVDSTLRALQKIEGVA
ncbi:MAG: BatD family protein [Verrucomicrobiota bacterium]